MLKYDEEQLQQLHWCLFMRRLWDRDAGKGRIPDLAVAEEFSGQGLGRRLIEHALDYFRREGVVCAVIETMAQNEADKGYNPRAALWK